MLRIQWQPMLNAFDDIRQQHRSCAEHKHRNGILRPAHLLFRVNASHAIEQPFTRNQHRIKKGLPSLEYSSDIATHGFCKQKHRRDEEKKLKTAIEEHL